jgi:hypothetical protein
MPGMRLAAKFTIFIFTRRFDVVVSVTSRVQSQLFGAGDEIRGEPPLSGADRATALYSVAPLRIVP